MCARLRRTFGSLLIAGMALECASAPAAAQAFFGVSAGVYEPGESYQDRTETFGLRGGYRFNPYFGLEGSLSRVALEDVLGLEDLGILDPFGLDFRRRLDHLDNLDLSLQWHPVGNNFLVFSGIGGSRLDATVDEELFGFRFRESARTYIFTAHAGLAYDWFIGDRFFVRPEVRARRYFGEDPQTLLPGAYKTTDYEVGLTLGWHGRFLVSM